MKTFIAALVILSSGLFAFAQDPSWPRKLDKPGGTAIVYQPQVDEWKDHKTLPGAKHFN